MRAEDMRAEDMRTEDIRTEDMRTEDMRKDDIRTEDITAASTCLLRLQNVIKKRNGWRVLDHASVTVRENRIIGVVGDNGIGKSTLLKLMAGLLRPDGGQIIREEATPSYILSGSHFYEWMTADDCAGFYRDFYPDFDRERALMLLEQSKIDRRTRLCRLSRGNQERLCMILGLCRKSRLYLFDEPFDGIDPYFKKDMKRFLLENMADNSSVVMATHLLKDLESLFDEVIFLAEGRVWQMETEEIRTRHRKSVEQYYLEEIKHD